MSDNFKKRMEEVENWAKEREKSAPFAKTGIECHIKARQCQNKEKARELYKESIENWEKVAEITNGESDYNQLLTFAKLIRMLKKRLSLRGGRSPTKQSLRDCFASLAMTKLFLLLMQSSIVSICWEADLLDKGEIYLRQWLAKFPNSSHAHSFLASLYELRGDIERTKSELLISIELNTNPQTYEKLAEIYVKENDVNKAIEIYRPLIEHFAHDVDSGIHCGAYKYFINLCFKNNNINEIVNLIQHIFIKLNEFIAGKNKPKIYTSQDTEWYIYKREQFNKTIKEILSEEVERLLEDNNIPKAEELLNAFINPLQNIENKCFLLVLNTLEAKIFRKQKKFDKSWRNYNETLRVCQKNEDISMVYSEMGEQLLEENKIQQAMGSFLYALSLTDHFYFARIGLKKALKLKKLHKHYGAFINVAKDMINFDDLQKKIDDLLHK